MKETQNQIERIHCSNYRNLTNYEKGNVRHGSVCLMTVKNAWICQSAGTNERYGVNKKKIHKAFNKDEFHLWEFKKVKYLH